MKRKDDTNLDEELAALLAGDLDDEANDEAEEQAEDENEAEYRLMQRASFDLAAFLDKLRTTEGVLINHQAIEVPLDAMQEAQDACVLFGLELAVDDAGNPYLIGAVVADDEQVVVVSRSFVEVENADPDEGGEWEDGA